jgi:dipeptidyl aminopeptidase/acylaminoacyl peptidase
MQRSDGAIALSRASWIAFALLVRANAACADSAPPSIEAFSHTPGASQVALSPDGTMLAMIEPAAPNYRVVMVRIKDGQRLRSIDVDGNTKLRRLVWADDRTVLMDASVALHVLGDNKAREDWEVGRTFALDLDGGKPRTLLMDDDWERSGVTGATLQAIDIGVPGKIAMATWDWSLNRHREQVGTKLHNERRDSGWTYNLYEVDLKSGHGRSLETGTPYTADWLVGPDGKAVARTEWNGETEEFTVLAKRGSGWAPIFERKASETAWLTGLAPDGRAVVVISENGGDRTKAWAVPLDGGAPSVLFEYPEGEIVSAMLDDRTHVVVGYGVSGGDEDVVWADEKRRLQAKALAKAFGGKRIEEIDRSRNGRQVLVKVGTDSEPPIIYLVDFDRGAADIVVETYPGLVGKSLGTVQWISYAARDGASIPAILTVPPGMENAKNLPLVVLPHGGPEHHDAPGFDWLSQFLATRGYAVLQPQFRGSTGFGKAHREAGRHQWGRLMQDDVTDGAAHLVSTGRADPKRICIMGASYGGYSALAGAAFTPDLYACAISINGVSDLPKMLAIEERRHGDESDTNAYWRDHIGAPSDPLVIDRSPARAAANVRAPILLLHGAQDTVVPILQSEVMDKALAEAGKPHKFVKLEGEDHWLSRSSTRQKVPVRGRAVPRGASRGRRPLTGDRRD